MKKLNLITIILCFSLTLSAGIKHEKFKNKQAINIDKWEVLDITFKAKASKQNPFTEQFDAVFTSPSGNKINVPGFYNGKNEWVLRFSAKEKGTWTYKTTSAIAALNNKVGTVEVSSTAYNNVKGAIEIPKHDPRHFYYEDGTPYSLMAFECDWLYALDYKNSDGLPRTKQLLNTIKENGFNQVVMNVYTFDINLAHNGEWTRDEKLKNHPEHDFGGDLEVFPFLGNNEEPDYSMLNVEFFKKLDRTISLMHDKEIVSHLMIYVWNKLVNWPDMYSEADDMYYDYVAKRYGAFPNIMWDVSKEALFYGRADDDYILERLRRLRNQNPFDRTITVHDYGFCKRHSDEVDYISRQTWNLALYQDMISDYRKFKNKPIFNIEHGGYEKSPYHVFPGSYTDAAYSLKRNYQCIFAGAYSTYYWQAAAWNVIIWNPFEQPEDFYQPKFEYFKHLTDFFTKYPITDYEPAPHRNQSGYAMKKNGEEQYLFYVPKETYQFRAQFMFDTEKEIKPVTFKWFNTLTGEYSKEVTATKKQDFVSPWEGEADAILVMMK